MDSKKAADALSFRDASCCKLIEQAKAEMRKMPFPRQLEYIMKMEISKIDLRFHLFIPLSRYHRNNPFVLFNSTEAITMSQQSTMGKKKLYPESNPGLSEKRKKPPE